MTHFNGLTPAEAERLAILAEECGEVVQVIGKILRHGFHSHHPAGGPSNRTLLQDEIGDVRSAVALMTEADDLMESEILKRERVKRRRIVQFLHHQDENSREEALSDATP